MTSVAAHAEVGNRVAAYLRQVWPVNTSKSAARRFDASPHTAEKWLAGVQPGNRAMSAMISTFGHRFVAFVFEPLIGPPLDDALDQKLADIESQIAALRAVHKGGIINAVDRKNLEQAARPGVGLAHGPRAGALAEGHGLASAPGIDR